MKNVYLLLGPEKGLKEDFINNIKNSGGPFEVSRFYAFDDYEEELLAQLNNQDLFADKKLVILDEAQEIKTKEKARPIAEYISNPSETVIFLVLSTELFIHPDIMGAVPDQAEQIKKFYELFENKKAEWLVNYFRRNSFSVSRDACLAIIEKVENNIQEFESVCSQLVTCAKTISGKTGITEEDVDFFLAHTRQETEFSLFSYMAQGKLESSLECLQTLLHTNDASSMAAVVASRLANFFRRAYSVHMALKSGKNIDDALRERYFDTDRAISMLKDKETYKACVNRYSARDIERVLVLLAEYDIKIKEEGMALQQTMLEKCIFDIICLKGRHPKSASFAVL